LLLWVAGGGDACGGAGGCVGNACFPHDDDSWTTGGGGRVIVFGFFFQRFSGSGGDAIFGEGCWRLLLLLVFSDGDVVDDVSLRAQDERLGLPFPQIISGIGVLAGDGFVGSFCFVSAKGCELPVIPQGGMWIPAVGVRSGVADAPGDSLATKMPRSFQWFTYDFMVGRYLLRRYLCWSSSSGSAGHGGGR